MAEEVKKPAEKTMPVKMLRGYYPADGRGKVSAGEVAELPVSEAKKAIESGVAERGDPLPA